MYSLDFFFFSCFYFLSFLCVFSYWHFFQSIETLARESNVSEETAEQYIRNLLRAIPKDGIEKANLEKHLSSSPFNFLSGLCCIFSRIKFNDAIRVLASVEVVAIDTFDKEKISFYRPVIGYAVENPYWYTYEKLKRME